jgi:hypothetical protein
MFMGLGRKKGDMGPLVSGVEREGGVPGAFWAIKNYSGVHAVHPAHGLKAATGIGSGISQLHGEL